MSLRTWAAWGVHLYTAVGAPLALVALVASGQGWFAVAFGCMALATFIDATDGQLARRVNVKQVLPHFDGARLDDVARVCRAAGVAHRVVRERPHAARATTPAVVE